MFRKELLIVGVSLVCIFAGLATATWFLAQQFQKNAVLVAKDTLPNLIESDAATRKVMQNYLALYGMLATPSLPERQELVAGIKRNSTETLWAEFGARLTGSPRLSNFNAMQQARADFLKCREQFFELVISGADAEAGQLLRGKLQTLYGTYATAAGEMVEQEAQEGEIRAESVARYAAMAPVAITALVVGVFVIGWAFGWRSAWSGPEFLAWFQKR